MIKLKVNMKDYRTPLQAGNSTTNIFRIFMIRENLNYFRNASLSLTTCHVTPTEFLNFNIELRGHMGMWATTTQSEVIFI